MDKFKPINLKINISNSPEDYAGNDCPKTFARKNGYRNYALCGIAICLIACAILLTNHEWVTAVAIAAAFGWLVLDRKMWNSEVSTHTPIINISGKEAWATIEKIVDNFIEAEVKELEDEVEELKSKLKSPNKGTNEHTDLKKEYDNLKNKYSTLYVEYKALEESHKTMTSKCQAVNDRDSMLLKEKENLYRENNGLQRKNDLLLEKIQLFDTATKDFGEENHHIMRQEIEAVLKRCGMHFEDYSQETAELYDYERANIKEIDYVTRAIVNDADKTVVLKGQVYLPK